MSNKSAVIIASLISAALIADFVLNKGTASLFLAGKFIDLTEYLAFWR